MISSMIKSSVTDETKTSLSKYFKELQESTDDEEIKNLAEQIRIEIEKI